MKQQSATGMGGFWPGLIGPYGGTKESEFWRPVKMSIACLVIFTTMLLTLVLILVLASDFVGPALLIAAVLLATAKQDVGKERPPMQKVAIKVLLWFSIAVTLFTIYIGGVPLSYRTDEGKLVVYSKNDTESSVRVEIEQGYIWITTAEYGAWAELKSDYPADWPVGPFYSAENQKVLIRLPLWVESVRWMLVAVGVGWICLATILLARLITEILFPALPNSVRAKPGLLARIFPFMKIRNVEYTDEEPNELGSVEPGGGEEAPWM